MKGPAQYIIIFFGTLLLAVAAMTAAMLLRPELFRRAAPPTAVAPARQDTVAPVKRLPKYGPTMAELAGPDSLRNLNRDVQPTKDSLKQVAQSLEPARLPETTSTPSPASDTAATLNDTLRSVGNANAAHTKAIAKILESMQAENAARILKDLSDSEVKELLLVVKKRQAAKILAQLPPERAARIIR
jgi:hypothetical protein